VIRLAGANPGLKKMRSIHSHMLRWEGESGSKTVALLFQVSNMALTGQVAMKLKVMIKILPLLAV
jgi:hypothetical protein